jgi:hypothetical protein
MNNEVTLNDFAAEVGYTVAVVIAAGVVIWAGKKVVRKTNKSMKSMKVWNKKESA